MAVISGNNLANVLYGSNDNDTIYGNGGNDDLLLSAGNDSLSGGTGNDYFAYAAWGYENEIDFPLSLGKNTLSGGSGDDYFSFHLKNPSSLTTPQVINGDSGYDELSVTILPTSQEKYSFDLDKILANVSNVEQINFAGNNTNNYYLGSTKSNVYLEIHGGNGNDTFVGKQKSDNFDGGFGNDLLLGNDGDDVLTDSVGNDTLNGGFGGDLLDISGGFYNRSTLLGGDGNDYISIDGSDRPTINGGNGTDSLSMDFSRFTTGVNVDASNPNNYWIKNYQSIESYDLLGGLGSDFLIGNAQGNLLDAGSKGNDTLVGGAGNDYLIANHVDYYSQANPVNTGGSVFITGGSGYDKYINQSVLDYKNVAKVVISDYQHGEVLKAEFQNVDNPSTSKLSFKNNTNLGYGSDKPDTGIFYNNQPIFVLADFSASSNPVVQL